MIEAPQRFNENPEKATEIKKNGTEHFGLDQDGVAKTIAAELLLTKENVGLGNVTNPGLANGSTLASDLKLITISGNYIYAAGATNAPTTAAGYAQVVITDANNRLVVTSVASGDGIVHIYHMQMVAGVWTDWSQAYELNYAKLNYVHFNEEITSVPTSVGSMYWDDDAKTVSLILPDGVIAQIPEELYINVVRDSAAPNPIVNGTPVYTIGELGQKPRVGVARADDHAKILVTGIATHDIANQGRITTFGLIRAVPLSVKPAGQTWVAGNYLWLAPTGGMTNVEPSAPAPNVRLGLIVNVTGSASFDMLVYIRPAMSLYDLYDVNGDPPIEGSELSFDFAHGYWKATNRLNVLEGDDTVEGSVAKAIDDALEQIETDKTLAVSGMAADAKVTGDKVGELKSAIDETATYETYANLFDKTAILTGKCLQVGSGHTINDVVDLPTLNVSGIIEVDGGQTYKSNSVLFGNNTARIYGYRDTGIYSGGIDPTISDGVCTYSIPALVKYIRFEYGPATVNIDQYMFVKGNLPSEYEPYGKHLVGGELYDVQQELLSGISDVDAKVGGLDIRNKLFRVANTIDDNGFTQCAYPDGSTGQIVTNASWTTFWCSDYTPILSGVTYYYNKIYSGGHFAFYDADQNFISGYEGVSVPNPFTSPSNAAYVRFLVVSSTVGAAMDAWINIINEAPEDTTTKYGFDKNTIFLADVDNPCDYSGNEISAFNKIICIGDSITGGTFNHNEGGTMQYVVYGKYSYPTYLTKLCGVETYNAGVGGYTSVQWWNNKQPLITSEYDCAIINLGINDALTGVSTSDTQTALTNIVNALKSANNNIKIFMATVVPAYSDGNTEFDAVNSAIKTVATNNGCYVIDLSKYSHARQATVCEAGHLTAWGYCQLAKDYIAAISYIMSKNRDAFKFIQFIGTNYTYS